ncbi:hypothetical protein BH10ACT9_BH10ACT9_27330 [soil metagenome]
MSGQKLTGRVALVEDDYTLVINRGADAGVTPGMVFAVYSDSGQVITDPESGRELGRLSREQLRVRVFDVHPLFARAHTFVPTDDFYGLLQMPFTEEPDEQIVTIDVGDTVALVHSEPSSHRAQHSGT